MLTPFVVLVNDDSIYNHKIVVYAREHCEALEQALIALKIPFNHVVSAFITPREEKVQ